jgi:hypothetical protein
MDRESHVGQSTVYDVYLHDIRFDCEMNRCAGIKVVRKRSRMACIGTENRQHEHSKSHVYIRGKSDSQVHYNESIYAYIGRIT